MKRTIEEITSMIKVENDISKYATVEVSGVCIDTRKVEKGNLFIPFKGQNVDGHQFVEDAIKKGASASLWQNDVPNPPTDIPLLFVEDTEKALQELARTYRKQLDVKVVGVTGSNGKTTTKDMVTSILNVKYKVQKTEGNYNNHLGLPLTILSLREDTDIAVLEMGMSARGEIDFLTRLAQPDVAIITNIGEAHLQDLGSREGIAEAKLEITKGLSKEGLFVYIGDEPLLRDRVSGDEPFKIKTFGKEHTNDVYPLVINQEESGSSFTLNLAPNDFFYLPVLGEYNVLNCTAAILTATYFGLTYKEIQEGLSSLKLTAMRMELTNGIKQTKIINDAYNASPTSMKAAIQLMQSLDESRSKIVVLGDMLELGEDEINFHLEVGKELDPTKIKLVYTYGNLGMKIAESAKEKFSSNRVSSFLDKQELIDSIKTNIEGNEWILVKASRGMKLEEVVNALQE